MHHILRTAAAIVLAGLVVAGTGGATLAKEEWQIGHGPFLSASDVRAHNKMPLDIRDVTASLEGERPDWKAALTGFAFGGNFPKHSLALFADDYNGRFKSHLPVSTAYFGGADFMSEALYAALAGTGRLKSADAAERKALVVAGLQAIALNWSRYELGESQRKGTASEPNWSLENGSPKNWNEVFAFWHGPDGQYSVYAALQDLDGGPAVNDILYKALSDGQPILVEKRWTQEHADQVEAQFDAAGKLLLTDALDKLAKADDASRSEARGRVAGYWLAAAEAVAGDGATAKLVEAALAADAGSDAATAALEAVKQPKVD